MFFSSSKIAKEADDAVKASEPDMLIHTFDQDPTDSLEFTWSEVYRTSDAMVHHINNPPVPVSYTHLTLPTIYSV